MADNKRSHVLGASVKTCQANRHQQNLKPSQTSLNYVNHQDHRHEVEDPTDSFVIAATDSLSDSKILPRLDCSESISQSGNDDSEQEELIGNNPDSGDTVVNK